MLSVLLIWCYVFVTTYVIGFSILRVFYARFYPDGFFYQSSGPFDGTFCKADASCEYPETRSKHDSEPEKNLSVYLGLILAGLTFVTLYAELFSLFMGVGLIANAVLLTGTVILFFFQKKLIVLSLKNLFTYFKKRKLLFFSVILTVLGMAYGTSRGYFHYDTALYHAQAVRWIEEYGAVEGLGNLHVRLAYNSAAFPMTALYSVKFLTGRSFHVMSGFLALLLALECIPIAKGLKNPHGAPAFFLRLMAVYYLVGVFSQMISPASDYFMMLISFLIFIKWADLIADNETSFLPYALYSLLAVFNVSVKLSAVMLVLLALKPAVMILKHEKKKLRTLIFFIACGFLILLPFLARNYILSGWLIYPFPSIDIFDVDWKIPAETAIYDANEIKAFGRGYTSVADLSKPFSEWITHWFGALDSTSKLFAVGALIVSVLTLAEFLIYIIRFLIFKRRPHKDTVEALYSDADVLLSSADAEASDVRAFPSDTSLSFFHMQAVAVSGYVFWLFTSPLVRYSGVFMWASCMIFAGRVIILFCKYTKKARPYESDAKPGGISFRGYGTAASLMKAITVLSFVFVIYKAYALISEQKSAFINAYRLTQKDYDNYPCESIEINGRTFYYPTEGDQTGYDDFPSMPYLIDVHMAGENLSDGFLPN